MQEDLMSLDELFAEAKKVLKQEKAPREPVEMKSGSNYSAPPSALFANEANWHPLRYVGLVHEESATFLGNFQELEHNTEPGCRKFRRLVGITIAGRVDLIYVSGPGYLEFRKAESNTYAPDITALECDELLLDSPPVSAHVVKIHVHRSNGGITRVKLDHETVFYSADVLLTLAAGTDILPALSHASKKLIKGML